MATTRRPAATASTAVAKTTKTQVALPAEIEAQIQADIERFKSKLSTPSGNRIAVTQAKQFKMPNGDSAPSITGVIVDYIAKKAYYPDDFDRDNIKPPSTDCSAGTDCGGTRCVSGYISRTTAFIALSSLWGPVWIYRRSRGTGPPMSFQRSVQ